jgi:LPXTG-motif cell wall-anchored protein
VSLVAGDDATCTIVNRDQPAVLTLVKKVVNDDGGTAEPGDWTLSAAGPTPISGRNGTEAVTRAQVDAGRYELSEEGGPDGYESGAWVCAALRTRSLDQIVLHPGDRVTCTITNDDVADESGDDESDADESGADDDGSPTASGSADAGDGDTGPGPGSGTDGSLPGTGSSVSVRMLALGGGLVLGGVGVVIVARRRRPLS